MTLSEILTTPELAPSGAQYKKLQEMLRVAVEALKIYGEPYPGRDSHLGHIARGCLSDLEKLVGEV